MSRLIAMGVGLILIGVVCFAHANQMDDVVQALILEASEESLEDVESTLLFSGVSNHQPNFHHSKWFFKFTNSCSNK